MSILKRIEELRNSGLSDKKVRAYLVLEDFSAKDITEAFKTLGDTNKVLGFKAGFYNWLAEKPRSEAEARGYILGEEGYSETSDNVKKSLSTNLNIWGLSKAIWDAKVEAAPETEAETSEREDAIKAAWDKLKKARAGKRKVKTIHPDKVSYLNDEELTAAYSDYFKNAA
ncbi:MAG: hypothetical protein GY795_07435 [Desulfobacterales bacterium]|nr:hypothetical protein [Desulfobacterales bacterium]